jgi:hypothetical protein
MTRLSHSHVRGSDRKEVVVLTKITDDPVRYPELKREIGVGDIVQRCQCPCVLVYDYGVWFLKPCDEHGWKIA